MSDAKSRGIPLRKILLVALAVFVVLFAVFTVWCWAVAASRWSEMERQVQEAVRESEAPPPGQPLLQGKPEPGDAAEAYARIKVGETYSVGWDNLRKMVERDARADPAMAAAELEQYRGVFDALHRGARRELITGSFGRPEIASLWRVGTVVSCRSMLLTRDGNSAEAADLLLDYAKYCRDLSWRVAGSDRLSIVASIESASLDSLHRMILSGTLNPAELARLEEPLEVLDRTLPEVAFMEPADAVALGLEFLESKDLFKDLRRPRCMCHEHACPPWGAWRFGFSDRLMAASAFRDAVQWARRGAELRSASWSECRRVGDAIRAEMRFSLNPLTGSHVVGLTGLDGQPREIRARLRLLRIAVRYRATGQVLDLADPLGTRILHRLQGTRLNVWSLGRDGVDHGGVGDWKGASDQKDILLEVDR